MMTNDSERPPLEEPLAEWAAWESIWVYVAGAGQDVETLRAREDNEAREIPRRGVAVREHEVG